MKKRIPYIPRKGKSKREMYVALEQLREQGYAIPKPKKKHEPIKIHRGHKWILERGNWGPHSARYICLDCDSAFVKWVSTKNRG